MMGVLMKRVLLKSVEVQFSELGEITPKAFTWPDGRCYEIDKNLGHKPAADLSIGVSGHRYDCMVLGRQVALWFDGGKWFMAGK